MPAVLERSLGKSPVTELKNVGAKMAEKLAKLGIHHIQDLLFHLPMRYLDRTRISPIASLQVGFHVVIEGEVVVSDVAFGKRRSLAVRVTDGSGTITLRFYHFSAAQKNNLKKACAFAVMGKPDAARQALSCITLNTSLWMIPNPLRPRPISPPSIPVPMALPKCAGVS